MLVQFVTGTESSHVANTRCCLDDQSAHCGSVVVDLRG